MSEGIRVDSRDVERGLDKLGAEVAAMPSTWQSVGDELLPGVRERTPVRSGRMAASWRAEGLEDRAAIGSDLPYAGVIEAVNAPIADTLAASERLILETLEEAIAREARRIGFEVRR